MRRRSASLCPRYRACDSCDCDAVLSWGSLSADFPKPATVFADSATPVSDESPTPTTASNDSPTTASPTTVSNVSAQVSQSLLPLIARSLP